MTIVYGGPTDPFTFPETTMTSYASTSAKTRSDPRNLVGDEMASFIVAGQSNGANHSTGSLYTPSHASKIDNLNPLDGGTYSGSDPALGASGNMASWLFRFADLVIDAGLYSRVVMVPVAVGGTSILNWAPGGIIADRLGAAIARCANVGLPITAVLWQQGEADTSMATADYKTNLRATIAAARSRGLAAPWLIGMSTYRGGVTSPTVRAACADVVNGVDIFSGADTDGLTGLSFREPALIHFNEAGINAVAGLWRDAVAAVFG